jgi:hypothetical protein
MPHKTFLEEYGLYRPFKEQVPERGDIIGYHSLNLPCPKCQREQTYRLGDVHELTTMSQHAFQTAGALLSIMYLCAACQEHRRYYFVQVSDDRSTITKVGQTPPWERNPDSVVAQMLGAHVGDFKKGLACELHGYGIGAYAYYRRIVEEVIDKILDYIADLIPPEERTEYDAALAEAKKTHVASEKIALVRGYLPAILRPGGVNPLGTLYGVLSEGLHDETDEECLELASTIRTALVPLVHHISAAREAGVGYNEAINKLQEWKAKKGSV